mgnify:CR=1 FL=1
MHPGDPEIAGLPAVFAQSRDRVLGQRRLPAPLDPLGNEGTCTYDAGTCNFRLGRRPQHQRQQRLRQVLEYAGWLRVADEVPGAAGGGVWHTGLIRDQAQTDCVAAGALPGKCQQYWIQDDGDTIGDNNWWDLL